MKTIIYYAIVILVCVILIFSINGYVIITEASIVPIASIVGMFFMTLGFSYMDLSVNTSDLNSDEEETLKKYLKMITVLLIPINIPFIVFFSNVFKYLTLSLPFIAIILSVIIFRIRHSKQIKNRINREQKE